MSAEQLLTDLDRQTIAVSKALAADAVEKAGSGHPGTPISLQTRAGWDGTGSSCPSGTPH